jgi:hypothetical protein
MISSRRVTDRIDWYMLGAVFGAVFGAVYGAFFGAVFSWIGFVLDGILLIHY